MKGSAAFLLGAWNLAGALRYEGGRPLSIVMNNDLEGILFNGQKRPNRVKGANGLTPRNGNFNPSRRATLSPAPGRSLVRCSSATRPRRDGSVRGFPTYNEDMNIFKSFR